MPNKPKRQCNFPGCSELVDRGYCELHKKYARSMDRERGTAAKRGYDTRWRLARIRFLRAHPLCVECERHGRLTSATVVDHIRPHKGDKLLFWDESNWQALCKPCHDAKTAREDGGSWRPDR